MSLTIEERLAPAKGRGSPDTPPKFYLRLSKRWIALVVVVLLVPWLAVLVAAAYYSRAISNTGPQVLSAVPTVAMVATTTQTSTQPTAPKVWGDLQAVDIMLEPPTDFAQRFLIYDSSVWHFRGMTQEQLAKVLTDCGVGPNEKEAILAVAKPEPEISGLQVRPPTDVLFMLSPECKRELYDLLSKEPSNYSKTDPFRFRMDRLNDWFIGSGLSPSSIGLVKKLMYFRNAVALFSDVSAAIEWIKDGEERVRLMRALARQRSVHAHLRITPDTDVSALLSYWGRTTHRAHGMRPMLESLTKVPGGCTVDIAAMLPTFARQRLFRFPEGESTNPNSIYDCHWTSMNFWNEVPDDNFANPQYVAEKIAQQYDLVAGGRAMGDVIFLVREDGKAIHSAVYIADDIVFTKNGGTVTTPWMLMHEADMMAYYQTHGKLDVRVYRKNMQ